MKVIRETTVFTDAKMPNHSYIVSSTGLVLGIRRFSQGAFELLRTPLSIDVRGRTFVTEDDLGPDTPSSRNIVEVAGSKGEVYTVDLDEKHCSCTGFKFRGDCKHIAMAKEEVAI